MTQEDGGAAACSHCRTFKGQNNAFLCSLACSRKLICCTSSANKAAAP